MKQRSWSSGRTLIVAAITTSGLTGCLRAPSTTAAVPLWVAPVGIGVTLLFAVGLRVLFLLRRRRRSSAGPGVTAQLARAQSQPQPTSPVLPSSSPGLAPSPFGVPAPLTGSPELVHDDSVLPAEAPPPPPAFAPSPAASTPEPVAGGYAGPVAGWYPDPGGRHAARYWDGGCWTRHTR